MRRLWHNRVALIPCNILLGDTFYNVPPLGKIGNPITTAKKKPETCAPLLTLFNDFRSYYFGYRVTEPKIDASSISASQYSGAKSNMCFSCARWRLIWREKEERHIQKKCFNSICSKSIYFFVQHTCYNEVPDKESDWKSHTFHAFVLFLKILERKETQGVWLTLNAFFGLSGNILCWGSFPSRIFRSVFQHRLF